MTALAVTDKMDAPTTEINLAVIDSTKIDVAAMDAAAMGAVTAAMDAPTVLMDLTVINSAVAMDAVDVVVGALPLSPKHVVRLEATTYPPTKTSSATQAIDTTTTGWRMNLSTSMPCPQGQQVPPASPHHQPVLLASPRHQLHAWLIGPACR